MNKNTKMILGVGAVAIVGYLVYKQMSKPKASFANLTSRNTLDKTCPCKVKTGEATTTMPDGTSIKVDICSDKHQCPQGLVNLF